MARSSNQLLFLTTGLHPGGAELQLARLTKWLARRNWNVHVVSMLPEGAAAEHFESAGIRTTSLAMRRGVPDPRAIARLINILRNERPVVFTSFMFHANVLGRMVGKMAGVPVNIASIRNENFGGHIRDRAMQFTDWMSDVTTTNSHLAAESLVRRGVVPKERLRVIPNGLDVTPFRHDARSRDRLRREHGLSDNDVLWLAVGRLHKQKDYGGLLRAFKEVRNQVRRTHLWIAGEGPLEQEITDTIRKLGLQDCCQLLGVRKDIPALLSAADCFVLSSAWEGLPNVIMEAFAAGKSVVATSVGGVPELVEDGRSGYLAPPRDPNALSNTMLRLMALPKPERQRMGEAGRQHIIKNYELESVVDQWEALFLELLERKGLRD